METVHSCTSAVPATARAANGQSTGFVYPLHARVSASRAASFAAVALRFMYASRLSPGCRQMSSRGVRGELGAPACVGRETTKVKVHPWVWPSASPMESLSSSLCIECEIRPAAVFEVLPKCPGCVTTQRDGARGLSSDLLKMGIPVRRARVGRAHSGDSVHAAMELCTHGFKHGTCEGLNPCIAPAAFQEQVAHFRCDAETAEGRESARGHSCGDFVWGDARAVPPTGSIGGRDSDCRLVLSGAFLQTTSKFGFERPTVLRSAL